ncbi:LysR family transcriptional regulator [Dongia deserti]|uniref:LysR family transcriptional regulator n=1 Tax=Dongia deserti TaxID=2268030 RepID=UPI000E64E753|nr:LysR family transcriptional regulator [Dongia deserti]
MNETIQWDDLRLFIAVARAGGLAGAARAVGVSPPTLGRRMTALEQSLGRQLFVRQRDGYELTSGGKDLLRLAEALELDALKIDRWRTSNGIGSVIRIAAGAWTSAFLARHMSELVDDDEDTQIELVTSTSPADLLRREANLGLRNRRPELPGLAGYKLTRVAFAVYGGRAYVEEKEGAADHRRFKTCRWIAFSPPGPKTPSAVWLDEHLARAPVLRCRSAQEVLEAASSGFGLCVLPCFIGDACGDLSRASGNIDELEHDQWLASHDEDRQQRHIRRVSKRLQILMKTHRNLFIGLHSADPSKLPSENVVRRRPTRVER